MFWKQGVILFFEFMAGYDDMDMLGNSKIKLDLHHIIFVHSWVTFHISSYPFHLKGAILGMNMKPS